MCWQNAQKKKMTLRLLGFGMRWMNVTFASGAASRQAWRSGSVAHVSEIGSGLAATALAAPDTCTAQSAMSLEPSGVRPQGSVQIDVHARVRATTAAGSSHTETGASATATGARFHSVGGNTETNLLEGLASTLDMASPTRLDNEGGATLHMASPTGSLTGGPRRTACRTQPAETAATVPHC